MEDQAELPSNRRAFLRSGIIFTGAMLASSELLRGAEEKKNEEKEAEVGPPEDLMREHGVLKRVLLIYGEALRRIDAKQDFPPDAVRAVLSRDRQAGRLSRNAGRENLPRAFRDNPQRSSE